MQTYISVSFEIRTHNSTFVILIPRLHVYAKTSKCVLTHIGSTRRKGLNRKESWLKGSSIGRT